MIQTRVESKRGCGYRKKGGIYLVSGEMAKPCGKLPIELTVCPCCGEGIKPARGWTWVQAKLIEDANCQYFDECTCNMRQEPWSLSPDEKMGLLWVGESFYKTPKEFSREAAQQGISRRISGVPKDFVIGETWVLLAHRKAISKPTKEGMEYLAGIFQAFRPDAIEYVVKGDETQEEIKRLQERGFTLVDVIAAEGKQAKI